MKPTSEKHLNNNLCRQCKIDQAVNSIDDKKLCFNCRDKNRAFDNGYYIGYSKGYLSRRHADYEKRNAYVGRFKMNELCKNEYIRGYSQAFRDIIDKLSAENQIEAKVIVSMMLPIELEKKIDEHGAS